jgi:LPS-assembly protein
MSRRSEASVCWLLALIIFWATSSHSLAASNDKAQLTLGDKISVFSDKAYRKNNGRYFEAVGNVVIISQKDTVYGEYASLDQDTMMVKIEGNVRLITKDLTLYGSHLDYNVATGAAKIRNARILTPDFNLVANELVRVDQNEYLAKEAEFTTCKDCAESWSVYGKLIKLRVGKTVQIKHGLLKVKGIDVIYIPYLVIPLLAKRETGLLVPRLSARSVEGLSFEQPFFWAIDEHKDLTASPTFWAKRGYGGDLQYRQRFADLSWFEGNIRSVNDTIYQPLETNVSESGEVFFRYFTELETHQHWTPNLTSHIRYTGLRDLDFIRDYPMYTENKTIGSDFGLQSFVNFRQELFSTSGQVDYYRNQLYSDPVQFDRAYVQTVPRLTFSTVPYSLVQSKIPFFQHIAFGADGSFSRFRQVRPDESEFIRNADRVSLQPYLLWNFFTWGPVNFKSRYIFDQQTYQFPENNQPGSGKNAGLIRSEVSFTMDRIFGLAFEEKIPLKFVSKEDLKRLRESKEQGLAPIQKVEKSSRLVGDLPEFEAELSKDNIIQVRNSYRHSQEFKFVHHFISSENTYGNKRFLNQIQAGNQAGVFDFEDTIRSQEYLFGSSVSRTIIPPENTLEFQWNNSLVRKTPKNFSFLEDDKYLRDNFSYTKIGWFSISQGYLLNQDAEDLRERLTRLMIDSGYSGQRWNVGLTETYFHFPTNNMLSLRFNRRFDYLNFISNYNYNTFGSSLQTLSVGGQVRPTDILGVAVVRDFDLQARQAVRSIYSIDIMPHNDCYIFSLGFQERNNIKQYTFNIMWNFGQDSFDRYRYDYFGVKRL